MRDELWLDGDVAALREGYARGATPEEIAEAIGRTPGAVVSKAYRLGIVEPTYRRWTEAEERRLAEVAGSGASLAETAEALGIPLGSVSGKARRMGVRFMRRGRVPVWGHRWTTADDVALLRARLAGKTAKEAAAEIGVSPNAARKRFVRLRRRAEAERGRATGNNESPRVLYVGYKGDEVLGVKTAEEWAAERGCSVRTIRWEATPSARKRDKGSGAHVLFERVEGRDGE